MNDAINQEPLSDDAVFHAGSIGKLVTATLVLQKIDKGYFSLDTSIDKWFPKAVQAQHITIDHLLNHTSGLPPHWSEHQEPEKGHPAIEASLDQPLLFQPGLGFSYSNFGYLILGNILEQEYQYPLADILDTFYIDIYGLKRSRAIRRENIDTLLVASTHQGQPGKEQIDYASPGGAGLLASTPCDLITILHATLSGKTLPRASLEDLSQRMYPMNLEATLHWSRGLMVLETPIGPVIYLAGRIKGFGALVAYHPENKSYVSLMVNDDTQIEPVMLGLFVALEKG